MCVHTYIHIYINIYTRIICSCANLTSRQLVRLFVLYLHTYIYIYLRIHIHSIHIYTYIHTYIHSISLQGGLSLGGENAHIKREQETERVCLCARAQASYKKLVRTHMHTRVCVRERHTHESLAHALPHARQLVSVIFVQMRKLKESQRERARARASKRERARVHMRTCTRGINAHTYYLLMCLRERTPASDAVSAVLGGMHM